MVATLVHTDSVTEFDVPDPKINPLATSAVTINGRTFLYVTGDDGGAGGVSVFEVSANGTMTHVDGFFDDDISFVQRVFVFSVDGQPFVFATDRTENAVHSFVALANGALLHSDTFLDAGNILHQLDGALDVVAAAVGGNNFAFIAGQEDSGIQVVQVANDGTLTFADSVNDAEGADRELNTVRGLATTSVGGTQFLFAGGAGDDGISVFSVANDGELTHVDSIDNSEDAALNLDGVESLATARVGNTTFLFAVGVAADGISVFEVANDGALTNVFNVDKSATLALDNPFGLTATEIAGTTYVFAAGNGSGGPGGEIGGLNVFAVAPDGTLVHQTTILADLTDGDPAVDAFGLSTTVIDGNTFVFASNGAIVSSLRVEVTGHTIIGTGGNDTINANSSAPGQLAPSELGDTISGLGGADNISGLGGKDTILGGAQNDDLKGDAGSDTLTGGSGRDFLTGGSEKDFFDFNAIGESVVGANRDRVLDFARGQADRIDLKDIDAKTGVAGNNAFTFIGTDSFNDVKGELRFTDLGSAVIVQGDVSGDGTADFEIRVSVGTMVAGDFIL